MKTKREYLDITGKIGQLGSDAEWPMYSYDRAAYSVWNAAANELQKHGWSEDEIRVLLQSKHPRWAMDCGKLCDALERAGKAFATECLDAHDEVKRWVKEGA